MTQRINLQQTHPQVYKAMFGLVASISNSTLTPLEKELIKVRASQINACAYCLNMHTNEALKAGETPQRLFLLSAWKEAAIFTEQEKALLSLVEEITLISNKGVSDKTYQQAREFFGEAGVGDIIAATVLINSWNRIAVSTQLPIEG